PTFRTGSESAYKDTHTQVRTAHVSPYTTCGLCRPARSSNLKLLIMKTDANTAETQFAALIGLDWGDTEHAVALLDCGSSKNETSTLTHSVENIRAWLLELEKRFGARPVAVALE